MKEVHFHILLCRACAGLGLRMTVEMEFFMYLLEYYAAYRNERTGDILKEWDKHGIVEKIYDNYEMYHTERIENAYMDIDSLLATGKPAW